MINLVSFGLAKLLKEKGYDKPVNNYTSERDGDYFSNEKQTISYKNYNEIRNVYSIPTIAEVVMWLYEKYGIWIECLHRGDMGDFTFKISKLKKGWRTEPHYIHESGYNSPTEAIEAAIEYVLKNLI